MQTLQFNCRTCVISSKNAIHWRIFFFLSPQTNRFFYRVRDTYIEIHTEHLDSLTLILRFLPLTGESLEYSLTYKSRQIHIQTPARQTEDKAKKGIHEASPTVSNTPPVSFVSQVLS